MSFGGLFFESDNSSKFMIDITELIVLITTQLPKIPGNVPGHGSHQSPQFLAN